MKFLKKGLQMTEMIELKKDYLITKSEKLLRARYQLGELALKLISIIYSNVRRSDEIGKDYQIKVTDISKLMNKNYGEMYNLLKQATNEMLENPVKIESKEEKKWVAFNWISDALYEDGVITFTISKRLKPYILDLQEKFLKYRLENILNLRGTYVIRLYEILKDRYNEKSRYSKKTEYTIAIRNLREMLEIPKSYQYSSGIKKRILEKAKQQFLEHTDITFEYEEIKTGRKITHIKFIIKNNKKNADLQEKNILQNPQQQQQKNIRKSTTNQEIRDKKATTDVDVLDKELGRLIALEEQLKNTSNMNEFRKKIIEANTNLVLSYPKIIQEQDNSQDVRYLLYEVIGGLVKGFYDEKACNAMEALVYWGNTFDNRNNLQIYKRKDFNLEKFEPKAREYRLNFFVNYCKKLDKEFKKEFNVGLFPLTFDNFDKLNPIILTKVKKEFEYYLNWEKKYETTLMDYVNSNKFLFIYKKDLKNTKEYIMELSKKEFIRAVDNKKKKLLEVKTLIINKIKELKEKGEKITYKTLAQELGAQEKLIKSIMPEEELIKLI